LPKKDYKLHRPRAENSERAGASVTWSGLKRWGKPQEEEKKSRRKEAERFSPGAKAKNRKKIALRRTKPCLKKEGTKNVWPKKKRVRKGGQEGPLISRKKTLTVKRGIVGP